MIPSCFLEPEWQLLLLLSRLELSVEQRYAAHALCGRIEDWSRLTCKANQCFVLPLVYRHLRDLPADSVAASHLDTMRRQCLSVVQHNLQLAAEQRRLVSELLEPLGITYLFFKGPSLAARYYDDPAARSCRDIDVLVPPERVIELLQLALKQGYEPCNPRHLAQDDTSLAFVARVQAVITLRSPRGLVVELHQRIDNTGCIYATSELLANAEHQGFNGALISVMPTAELFVYLCLHHTKHFWSHLHWLADLDALQRHPDFDLEEVHACAARRRLSATVDACLELFRACASPVPGQYEPPSEPGRKLLAACFNALQGELAVELAMRKRKVTPDFAFAWQTSAVHRWRWRLLGWTRLFRPSYADYQSWPLPSGWQWLYHLTRPFRELAVRLGSSRSSK